MQRKEIPPFMTFEVRSNLADPALFSAIEQTALRLDKNVPVTQLKSETVAVSEVLYLERTFATLSSAFGGLALLLAGLGLYGTIAYTVAQRTNEIGIRMAVGADRQNIVTMIVRETLTVVAAGLLVGLPIAWFASRALRSQLFGLSPHDAVSMGIARPDHRGRLGSGWRPSRPPSLPGGTDGSLALRVIAIPMIAL